MALFDGLMSFFRSNASMLMLLGLVLVAVGLGVCVWLASKNDSYVSYLPLRKPNPPPAPPVVPSPPNNNPPTPAPTPAPTPTPQPAPVPPPQPQPEPEPPSPPTPIKPIAPYNLVRLPAGCNNTTLYEDCPYPPPSSERATSGVASNMYDSERDRHA